MYVIISICILAVLSVECRGGPACCHLGMALGIHGTHCSGSGGGRMSVRGIGPPWCQLMSGSHLCT